MDKIRHPAEPVIFNYHMVRGKYFILTDKTGYPSAEFNSRSVNGLIVPQQGNSSANTPNS
ncbi:MAG: hypothetical protein ACYDEQ_08665 [Desulfocucumaceae bacterium]